MVDMAISFFLNNKIVFVYAMAPFLSLRAIEKIKCGFEQFLINILLSWNWFRVGLWSRHYATEDPAQRN